MSWTGSTSVRPTWSGENRLKKAEGRRRETRVASSSRYESLLCDMRRCRSHPRTRVSARRVRKWVAYRAAVFHLAMRARGADRAAAFHLVMRHGLHFCNFLHFLMRRNRFLSRFRPKKTRFQENKKKLYPNPSEPCDIARDAVVGRAPVRSLWVAAGRQRERVRCGVSIGFGEAQEDSRGDCGDRSEKESADSTLPGIGWARGRGYRGRTRVGKGVPSGERCHRTMWHPPRARHPRTRARGRGRVASRPSRATAFRRRRRHRRRRRCARGLL